MAISATNLPRRYVMKMPGGDRAVVPWEKLTEYSLNPHHRFGGHKARVFAAALGITSERAGILRDALIRAAAESDAILKRTDEYGDHYAVSFRMETPAGQATVLSGWVVRAGEDFPRLVTCHVDDERRKQ